jgi:signal peptidase II
MAKQRIPLLPFILTIGIIIADQVAKFLIVQMIPYRRIGISIMNDFIRIIHARNLGMAFSIGNSLPAVARKILFIVLPAIVMVVVLVYYVRSNELTIGMRWALAGIVGGGIGNLIDRVFRPLGVVDFLDVRVYGFLGFERWPVFNVADSSVVVSGITLIVLFALYERTLRRKVSSSD